MIREIYKLFTKKENYVFLLCGLACMAVLLLRSFVAGVEYQQQVHEIYDRYAGRTWPECQPDFEAEYTSLKELVGTKKDDYDLQIRLEAFNLINGYISEQSEHRTQLMNVLTRYYEAAANGENTYYERAASQTFSLYNYDYELHIWDHQMLMYFCRFFNDRFFDLIYLTVIILVVSRIFTLEDECGMLDLLGTTVRGRRHLYNKKLMVSGIVLGVYAVVFTALQTFIALKKTYLPLRFLLEPVQSMLQYAWCPYRLNVLELMFIAILGRILAGMFSVCLITLLSVIFHNTIVVLIGGLLINGMMVWSNFSASMNMETWGINVSWFWNHVGLINIGNVTEMLQNIHQIDVLGYPVDLVWIAVAITVMMIVWLLQLSKILYINKNS